MFFVKDVIQSRVLSYHLELFILTWISPIYTGGIHAFLLLICLFFFLMGSGGLNQEPRMVEGQSFFFPYNDSMLSFTHSLAIIHLFMHAGRQYLLRA